MREDLDTEQLFAMYIAVNVRNNMEDFHVEHLTDAQMAILNPLIRDAIYTALVAFREADHNSGANRFVEGSLRMIPNYWEPPKLLEGYRYMASGQWEEDLRKL